FASAALRVQHQEVFELSGTGGLSRFKAPSKTTRYSASQEDDIRRPTKIKSVRMTLIAPSDSETQKSA
ncbi:MAG TPA: hypothetical protein VNH64_06795, partial [Parvularculaceae bacterium]|nr:hypothetical protein [Parvularculaceae bacterium]